MDGIIIAVLAFFLGSFIEAWLQRKNSRWQPIDTAPHDAEILLGEFKREGSRLVLDHVDVGCWVDAPAGNCGCCWTSTTCECSWGWTSNVWPFSDSGPTHWRLLEPPTNE